MGFPDRIERTVPIAHPPEKVWAALTTAEGLGAWFGNEATVIRAQHVVRRDRPQRQSGDVADSPDRHQREHPGASAIVA